MFALCTILLAATGLSLFADEVTNRILIRKPGDDGSKAYRIPGLATSVNGTLLAVYDVRYAGFADLPGDIDVGLRRSFDGGKTWEAQQIIVDYDKAVPNTARQRRW
ncbi:MAG: sialidase family protein [Pirellulales bacterium]